MKPDAMKGTTVVRSATPSDADAILALERACFAIPWSEASIRHDLSDNPEAQYWVAVADGRIAGYVGMWRVLDEAQVMDLAVSPSCRRRGIGRLLVRRLLDESAEAGLARAVLEVRSKNAGALALYESLGFRREGLRPQYYPDDGDDAVLMGRSLEEPGA